MSTKSIPVKPATRFVIDDKGKRVPVSWSEDIVEAARKAKGNAAPAAKSEEN